MLLFVESRSPCGDFFIIIFCKSLLHKRILKNSYDNLVVFCNPTTRIMSVKKSKKYFKIYYVGTYYNTMYCGSESLKKSFGENREDKRH